MLTRSPEMLYLVVLAGLLLALWARQRARGLPVPEGDFPDQSDSPFGADPHGLPRVLF